MTKKKGPVSEATAVQFAEELSNLRGKSDISQRELGRMIGTSGQQVGAVERLARSPSKRFAELADQALNANGSLLNLWPGGRVTTVRWLQKYVELEEKALVIQQFQAQVVPALLQTEAYARATLEAARPPSAKAVVAELLRSRMERKKLLARDQPPMVHYVIDEGVLRREIGGPEVMAGQLAQVTQGMANPFVTVQVLPYVRGAHAGLEGSFTVLGMTLVESLVYVETVAPGQVHTDSQVVSDAIHQFSDLRALALSPAESLRFIGSLQEGNS